MKVNAILIAIFFTVFAQAQERESGVAKILSLMQWKAQQRVEAENRIVRISNQLQIEKKNGGNIKKINKLDSELRVAAQGLELVQELGVEDYFNVYLAAFSDSDAALVEAARMMTEVEMAQLLKALLKSKAYSIAGDDGISTSSLIESLNKRRIEAQL